MKINNAQIDALAALIEKDHKKNWDNFLKKNKAKLDKEAKLTKAEVKELKTLADLSKKYSVRSINHYHEEKNLKNFVTTNRRRRLVEELAKKEGILEPTYKDYSNIKQAIVLATIESDDLESLTENAKEIYLKKNGN